MGELYYKEDKAAAAWKIIALVVLAAVFTLTMLAGAETKDCLTNVAFSQVKAFSNEFTACSNNPKTLNAEMPQVLVPVGRTAGIKLYTDGIIIVSLAKVISEDTVCRPALDAGLKPGDIITEINGKKVLSESGFTELLNKSGGSVELTVTRNEKKIKISVVSVKTQDGLYKIGAVVRDSMAGIGTITFYDPKSGTFGGLGHPICDVDTGVIMPAAGGGLVISDITGVKKGKVGSPGELSGSFELSSNFATLYCNNTAGIFGLVTDQKIVDGMKSVPVAAPNQVHTGAATILANIDGTTVKAYDIEITAINDLADNDLRDMQIKITDEELLSYTGGIVQGMSGSPILQDGRLAGAVTHVFINDPQKGYAIFIGGMLNNSGMYTKKAA